MLASFAIRDRHPAPSNPACRPPCFPVIDSSQPVPGHQERSEVFDVVPFPARAFLLRFRRSLSDRFTRGRNAFHSPHGRNLRTGPCKRAITAPTTRPTATATTTSATNKKSSTTTPPTRGHRYQPHRHPASSTSRHSSRLSRPSEDCEGCPALAGVRNLAKVSLWGARSGLKNGVVVALRRRRAMVLRGRNLAGRWGRVRALHCCRRWCLAEHAD